MKPAMAAALVCLGVVAGAPSGRAQDSYVNGIGQLCTYELVRTPTGYARQYVCRWANNTNAGGRYCEIYCSANDSRCIAQRRTVCGF